MKLCKLLGVTADECAHLPTLVHQKGAVDGSVAVVGANVNLEHLRLFLKLRMPAQRSRAQVLWARRLEEAKVPNRELWVLDEEPAYHYELQATEEGWGVVKTDVGMHPVYSLKGVMTALQSSFERLWDEELCCSLVRRCRDHEARFWCDDSKVFGKGGMDEDVMCSSEFCTLNAQMSAANRTGEAARAVEVRRCGGVCGGDAFHKECLTRGRQLSGAELEEIWPTSKTFCNCGCSHDLADESEDEEETEGLSETQRSQDKARHSVALALASQRASNAAAEAAAKPKPPGAAKSLER